MNIAVRRIHTTRTASGFTLIELLAVIMLMSVIAALTFPNFYPAIAFSELQRSAKHMANYGRVAMAEATMMQRDITVRIDLKTQEVYAVQWILPEEQLAQAEGLGLNQGEDMLAKLGEMRGMRDQMASLGAGGAMPKQLAGNASDFERYMATFADYGELPEGFDPEAADLQMLDRFDAFARRMTMARVKNVKHDDFLEEVDVFEGYKFNLEGSSEPIEAEVENPLLARVTMPDGIRIESVEVDGVAQSKGLVEIQMSSLGLSCRVVFHFVSEDRDYYTVFWDPMFGGSQVMPGKETFS